MSTLPLRGPLACALAVIAASAAAAPPPPDAPLPDLSHGHGQGYADLHWIIPEVVQRVEVSKGPYFAEHGDFATAGAIDLVTKKTAKKNELVLSGGSFETFRGLVIVSPELEGWSPLLAFEVYGTQGPFDRGEALDRYNLFAKVTHDPSDAVRLSLVATSYGSGWRGSGQIPLREVAAGRLGRFGSVDPNEGGNSQRHSVQAAVRINPDADSELSLMGFVERYELALFSNFTFFSRDPVNGDAIEQTDDRSVSGLKARYRKLCRWGDITFDTSLGGQMRHDDIDNALYYTRSRERLAGVVDAHIVESSLGTWAEEAITWTPWLRTILGLRFDYFGFDVDDRREDLATLGTQTSGTRSATLVSPKLSAVVSPVEDLDLFLNFGTGFHSNDARGVVRGTDPVTPLTRAIGYEVGARTRLFERVDVAASLFALDLDSETVWVGDEGTTEARGATRRRGLEAEVRAELTPWLFADFDLGLSEATYAKNAGNGKAVALAPTLVVAGGVSARHPSGLYGRIGAFHLGDRNATEDGFLRAEGFTRLDLTLGYEHPRFSLELAVGNVLDADIRETQFANVSRLPGETSAAACPRGTRADGDGASFAGCEDIHFTPGAPLDIQARASVVF